MAMFEKKEAETSSRLFSEFKPYAMIDYSHSRYLCIARL